MDAMQALAVHGMTVFSGLDDLPPRAVSSAARPSKKRYRTKKPIHRFLHEFRVHRNGDHEVSCFLYPHLAHTLFSPSAAEDNAGPSIASSALIELLSATAYHASSSSFDAPVHLQRVSILDRGVRAGTEMLKIVVDKDGGLTAMEPSGSMLHASKPLATAYVAPSGSNPDVLLDWSKPFILQSLDGARKMEGESLNHATLSMAHLEAISISKDFSCVDAQVRLPPQDAFTGYLLPPMLLDAAFHACSVLVHDLYSVWVPMEVFAVDDMKLFPGGLSRVGASGAHSASQLCRVRLSNIKSTGPYSPVSFDCCICDLEGTLMALCDNVRARRIAASGSHSAEGDDAVSLAMVWEESRADGPVAARALPQRCLIIGSEASCTQLETEMRERFASSVSVVNDAGMVIDCARFDSLLVPESDVSGVESRRYDCAVLLGVEGILVPAEGGSAAAPAPPAAAAAAEVGARSEAAMVALLTMLPRLCRSASRMLLVGRDLSDFRLSDSLRKDGCEVSLMSDAGNSLAMGSALGGVVRSAQLEYPDTVFTIVDVRHGRDSDVDDDPATTDGGSASPWSLSRLPDTTMTSSALRELFDEADGELECVYSGGRRFVRRYVDSPLRPPGEATSDVGFVRAPGPGSSGAVIITGGLGGLGLLTAEVLCSLGAPDVVLVSRSGSVSRAEQGLGELLLRLQSSARSRIHIEQCDVSDEASVVALLSRVRSVCGGISGIVHAAGVIRDGLLRNQRKDIHWSPVWANKATSALYLHKHTMQDVGAFFVAYSSTTSACGNAGQVVYGAANAYLDGLVSYRRGRGMPALSIRWPAVRDVGMAVHALADLDAKYTVGPDSVRSLLYSAFQGWGFNYPGVLTLMPRAVMRVFRNTPVVAQFDLLESSKKLSSTLIDQNEISVDSSKSVFHHFGKQETISELINRMVCDVLGKDSKLSVETNLLELGLESFAMTELSHSFSVTFGVSLSPLFFYDQPLFGDLERAVLALMRK